MRIMLVDDEPFALRLLSHQLESLGYADITTHDRAHHALSVLDTASDAVDLIFCDLQMPGMDGVEFVRQLVRVGYGNGLVLISGEDERVLQTAEKLARAHNLNVFGSLAKPVFPGQLQQLMEANTNQAVSGGGTAQKVYDPAELQGAIERGELVNYYQPKVELATASVVGVETLVRWQHPADGLVLPDRFIATAEENGLIDDLTRVVLTNALQQARQWHDMGMPLRVAVNVSMDNLTSLDFPDFVECAAAEAGVELTNLVLEVTESRLMHNPLAAWDILARLRLKHIGLSIDDFGTGHSSLSQLRDVPFDELKIDRSFVHGASRNRSQRAILEASLGMARELGLKTVAEGVEDREDWEFLRKVGCDMVQGYFIAKPMPAKNLKDCLARCEMLKPV